MSSKGLLVAGIVLLSALGFGQQQGDVSSRMGIDQNLGAQIPLDTPVMDEHGKQIVFGQLLHGRPAVLMPIFFTCKGVCGIELQEMLKTAIRMKKTYPIGEKFDWIALSINPKETPDLALAKERQLQDMYSRSESAEGWHMLTASYENIRRITDAVGFRYEYKPETDTINHPAGVILITPEGKVSSYVYGAEYPTKVLKDGLDLAGQGKVGEKAEIVLLGCIMVDPVTGKRTLMIKRVLIFAGCLTVLILAFSIVKMSLSTRHTDSHGGEPTQA